MTATLKDKIAAAISNPGATQGPAGKRFLTEWQSDAVLSVLTACGIELDGKGDIRTDTKASASALRAIEILEEENAKLRLLLMMSAAGQRQTYLSDLLDREGSFNRRDLCETFAISKQQASADIQTWLDANPGVATYNSSTKRYERAPVMAMTMRIGATSPFYPGFVSERWPPLKAALWREVVAAQVNAGRYLSAWDLTHRLYTAAVSVIEPGSRDA